MRQGSPLSLNSLEPISQIELESGVSIDSEQLSHLRFANNTVLIANNDRKINEVLQRNREMG